MEVPERFDDVVWLVDKFPLHSCEVLLHELIKFGDVQVLPGKLRRPVAMKTDHHRVALGFSVPSGF